MHIEDIAYLNGHLHELAGYTSGKQLFVVGGAVRDILLGINKEPKDIDMTLAGEPDVIFAALEQASRDDYSLFRTEKFGTMTMIDKKTEVSYELTPFREEGGYEDHRHPDQIAWSNSLLADAKRRDFTINCIYYTFVSRGKSASSSSSTVDQEKLIKELSKHGWYYQADCSLLIVQQHELIEKLFADGIFQGEVFDAWVEESDVEIKGDVGILIDPFFGIQDLYKGVLRAVGDANKRFQEDALRILRAVRIVNILNQKLEQGNFDFEKETWLAMKEQHALVPGLAKERLHQEIEKVFRGNNPFGWVALIDDIGLLATLFPALAVNKYDEQPVRYHPFDTYSHTLLTLWQLQQINDNYLVKLGMLYHDVGKKDQYAAYAEATTKEEIEEIHRGEANHVICGPEYAARDFRALGFSNKEIEEIQFYIAYHMRPGQILTANKENQLKKVRKLLSEHGYERVKNLFDITVADRKGQFNPLQSDEVESVQHLYVLLDKLYNEEGQFTMRELAIDGNVLMEEFDLSPGPQIKELLDKAFDWVLSDIAARNSKKTILSYLRSQE